MKALISTLELRESGFRVAQVEQDSNVFPVASAMFWIDCADDVVADKFWFDPQDKTIKLVPVPVIEVQPQPIVDGAQTL